MGTRQNPLRRKEVQAPHTVIESLCASDIGRRGLRGDLPQGGAKGWAPLDQMREARARMYRYWIVDLEPPEEARQEQLGDASVPKRLQ